MRCTSNHYPRQAFAAALLVSLCSLTALGQHHQFQNNQGGGQGNGQILNPPGTYSSAGVGSNSRSSFAGIGQGRPSIDLLSNPARERVFRTPQTFQDRPVHIANPAQVYPAAAGAYYHHRYDEHRFHRVKTVVPYVPYSYYSDYGYASAYSNPFYPGAYYPNSYPYPYPYTSTYDLSMQQRPAVIVQQPAPTPTPAPPASPVDIAKQDLRDGQPGAAITELRRHVQKNQNDAAALRLLSVALLEAKRFDEAAATLRYAYKCDPNLASDPIDAGELGLDATELRSLVTRTVTYAHRANTGSAWLTVVTLMQAEGRREPARAVLERSAKLGLETQVLTPMKAALGT